MLFRNSLRSLAIAALLCALVVASFAPPLVRVAHASSASNEFICTKTAYAPGALTTLVQASTTVTCPGVTVGDICDGISSTVDPGAGIVLTCYISAANTVRIQVFNSTAGTLTPASANYTVLIQPKYISP
ncbi:MAG: hypothetical protein ACRETD_06670 [Steroidobacteraceae bacterium]